MKLTEIDKKILRSYNTVIDGLAEYLGEGCEIVLHSLEDLDHSVVKIVNGHHTGREVGAPITNLALNMLNEIQKNKDQTSIAYYTYNNKGEPLKSTTIVIKGERDRLIGLLCINFYMNMPLSQFLAVFGGDINGSVKERPENFIEYSSSLYREAVEDARASVFEDSTILPSLRNKEIIRILYEEGIFNMKNAVEEIASLMDISKNTVYLHLRTIKKEK